MKYTSGIYEISDAQAAAQIAQDLMLEGWKVFFLPSNMSNKEQFFAGVRQVLPLDPPVYGNRSWDAMSDSLWSGLDGLHERRIVIVWPDSNCMKKNDLDEFRIAYGVLEDICASLSDIEATVGEPKDVVVLQEI